MLLFMLFHADLAQLVYLRPCPIEVIKLFITMLFFKNLPSIRYLQRSEYTRLLPCLFYLIKMQNDCNLLNLFTYLKVDET